MLAINDVAVVSTDDSGIEVTSVENTLNAIEKNDATDTEDNSEIFRELQNNDFLDYGML